MRQKGIWAGIKQTSTYPAVSILVSCTGKKSTDKVKPKYF
jgi:hypothetical protein